MFQIFKVGVSQWARNASKSTALLLAFSLLLPNLVAFTPIRANAISIENPSTFSVAGTYPFIVPSGVTEITVEAWGAGGGAGNGAKGQSGGGGGAYASSTITVVSGNTYFVEVGMGGTPGNDGGDSYFDGGLEVKAGGGKTPVGADSGGLGGAVLNGVGFVGGNGGKGSGNAGGGGGGSAMENANGGAGSNSSSNNGGSGGIGKGDGGDGGNKDASTGQSGNNPGGGGGGKGDSGTNGSGASGLVKISWTEPEFATLTLVKVVDGGESDVSDWTLTAIGPETITGTTGSSTITSATVLVGTYTLSESGDAAGYDASDWVCSGDETFDTQTSELILVKDDVVTCTITNTFTEVGGGEVKTYSVIIDPNLVDANDEVNFTITVTNTTENSNSGIKSLSIVVPVGFSTTTISNLQISRNHWAVEIVNNTIRAEWNAGGQGANNYILGPGESLLVSFTATTPEEDGEYEWITSVWTNSNYSGDPQFIAEDDDVMVTVGEGEDNGNGGDTPDPLDAPILESPAQGASLDLPSSIQLSWQLVTNELNYTIEILSPSSVSTTTATTSALTYNIDSPELGVYSWRVQAYNSTTTSPWSETRTFSVVPKQEYVTLTYEAGIGGTIMGSTTQTLLLNETGTTVTASSSVGYEFSEWSDGLKTESRTDSNVSTSTIYTAVFKELSVISFTGGGGGSSFPPPQPEVADETPLLPFIALESDPAPAFDFGTDLGAGTGSGLVGGIGAGTGAGSESEDDPDLLAVEEDENSNNIDALAAAAAAGNFNWSWWWLLLLIPAAGIIWWANRRA
jgi:hypothetical protein